MLSTIIIFTIALAYDITCGVVGAKIAKGKSRSAKGAFWLGFLLGILGVVIVVSWENGRPTFRPAARRRRRMR
jgi:hypothetical protein